MSQWHERTLQFFYMGHIILSSHVVLWFRIVILVFPNTHTSDTVACLTLQVLLVAVAYFQPLRAMNPDVCWQLVYAMHGDFQELCRVILLCSGMTWMLLFSFFLTTLRTVQYTLKPTYRTEAVIYFWKHKIFKCIWCRRSKHVIIYIIRNINVWICSFFRNGKIGHLKAACWVNSNARFSPYHEAQLILFVNVLLVFIGIISNKHLTFWSYDLMLRTRFLMVIQPGRKRVSFLMYCEKWRHLLVSHKTRPAARLTYANTQHKHRSCPFN